MAIFTNVEWEGKPLDTKVDFHLYGTDHRFGETFDLKMLMGRWWTEGNELSVVLNESAVRAMGLQAPVGSIIRMPWWSDFSVIKNTRSSVSSTISMRYLSGKVFIRCYSFLRVDW